MRLRLVAAALVVAAFITVGLWWRSAGRAPSASVTINGHAFYVAVARAIPDQQRGLAGRSYLAANQGMLFIFDRDSPQQRVFWMKGMRFPIDIIWLMNGRVIGVAADAPVPRNGIIASYGSPEPVDAVLEIGAGLSRRFHFQPGDIVSFSGIQ